MAATVSGVFNNMTEKDSSPIRQFRCDALREKKYPSNGQISL
jgi:hypothetical protein